MFLKNVENGGAGAGRCRFKFQTLYAISQYGLSLEYVAATAIATAAAVRECNIQKARDRGLCVSY